MPLFTPSTLAWSSAVEQIADSAGASADNEMRTRAHRSLRAAFQYLNSERWDFIRAEANPIGIIAPFYVTGVSASAGQGSAAAPAGHGFVVDDVVQASGFLLGTRVSATAVSGFGIYGSITGLAAGVNVVSATALRDYYNLPSDWKVAYSVRLLGSQRALGMFQRRMYDRLTVSEFIAGTPEAYDVFGIGAKGKIRLLPAPSASDTLFLRYYRRMYLGSATGDSTNLDIPEDYEQTPIAWAKWHFLTDKSEARQGQGTTWLALAREGLATMKREVARIPDEDLGFLPGAVGATPNVNSTSWTSSDSW